MKEVSLFIPCTVDLFLPHVGEATVNLLRRAGVKPIYHEEQTCCGQPAMNSGYRREARAAAKHFIEVFGNDEIVVSPSGSCVCMAKFHYPELFEDEPDWRRRAEDLGERIYELTQFLVDGLKVEDLGVSEQPKKLLRAVKGAELVPMEAPENCCGFGGEFANEFPDISEGMVSLKVERFLASGADTLLLCEPGCLLNIGGYLNRRHPGKRAMHVASFLAQNGKGGNYGN